MKTNINCILGGSDHLLNHLNKSFRKAKSVDIIVSFLMVSGVRLLEAEFSDLLKKKVPLRILTGNYLNITEPHALYLLKSIMGENVDLRFYNIKNISFHPKAYIFNYENDGEIFVGSSNMSNSALTKGIEWNYRLTKDNNEDDFNYFKDEFENLFLNHSKIIDEKELKDYSDNWKKPKLQPDRSEKDEEYIDEKVKEMYEPRGAQIEALYELDKSRIEGFDKGLVVAATGERVIIVTGCINALRSRVSGTLVNMIHALLRVIKYNYCKQCMRSKDVLALQY